MGIRIGPVAESQDGYNYRHFVLPQIYDPTDDGPAVPGLPAPEFSLRDVAGNPVRLGDLRGKPVVIEFGAIT